MKECKNSDSNGNLLPILSKSETQVNVPKDGLGSNWPLISEMLGNKTIR